MALTERVNANAAFRLRRAAAFALPAVLIPYYALRGGSYDIVVRQEEALAVWWVLLLGFALGILLRVRPPASAAIPIAGLALLAVWTALAFSWTESDERTLAELARVLHYLGLIILVLCLVGRSTWRPAAAGLVTGAVFVCAIAVAARLTDGIAPDNALLREFEQRRLSYPLNYWNAVAVFSAMASAMTLAWSAHARGLITRGLALSAFPICLLAAYLTYARQAPIGVAVAILAVIAVARNRWLTALHAMAGIAGAALAILVVRSQPAIVNATGTDGGAKVLVALAGATALCALTVALTKALRADRWRLPPRAARLVLASGGAALVVVALALADGPITDAWDQLRTEPDPVGTKDDPASRLTAGFGGGRYAQWVQAVNAFEAEPLHGIGPGTFEFFSNRQGESAFVRDTHSLYLEQMAEAGIPGLILIVVVLAGLLTVALRARSRLRRASDVGAHAALVGAFVVYIVHAGIDWMWESTAVSALAFVSIAVAIAAAAPSRAGPGPRVRAPLAVLALFACLVILPGLVSTSRQRDAQASVRAGDLRQAHQQAADAVESQPWAASPYVQRALVLRAAGDLRSARRDLLRAAEREPTNWRHPLLLARVEAELGRPAQALAAYRDARRLRPGSVFVRTPGAPGAPSTAP